MIPIQCYKNVHLTAIHGICTNKHYQTIIYTIDQKRSGLLIRVLSVLFLETVAKPRRPFWGRTVPHESVVMDPLHTHLQFQNRSQLSGCEVKQTALLQTIFSPSSLFFLSSVLSNSIHLTIATGSNLLPRKQTCCIFKVCHFIDPLLFTPIC